MLKMPKLNVQLLPHQQVGLDWMIKKEEQQHGGILADDMGLGKTLTAISLIVHQKGERIKREADVNHHTSKKHVDVNNNLHNSNSTLIAVPVTLMGQWKEEIKQRVEKDGLSVFIFYTPKDRRQSTIQSLAQYDVIITTYTLLGSPLLNEIRWERIILDEAHYIRNKDTTVRKSACRLEANKRWCLTGTPVHNSARDVYNLIRFLRISPYNDENIFNHISMNKSKLNEMIKQLILRRTKDQMCPITNKPLIPLPPKEVKVHYLRLEGIEAKVYDVLSQAKSPGKDDTTNPFYKDNNTTPKGKSFTLTKLLRTRQGCDHMNLLKKALNMEAFVHVKGSDSGATSLEKQMDSLSIDDDVFERKFMSCKVKKIMEITKEVVSKQEKLVIVSQWPSALGIVAEALENKNITHTSIYGNVLPFERQDRVTAFNTNKTPQVMLLSLTAGGVGLTLTGANHLIIADLHWNPALEAQACDRVYRISQTRKVFIHKLITSNTVEERVLKIQEDKTKLAKAVLEGAASTSMTTLTKEDALYLLDSKK